MNEIRKHPVDMIKENIGTFAVAAGVYYLFNGLLNRQSDSGIILSTIIMFVSAAISASSASFYFNAIHRGRPELKDMYSIFTDNSIIVRLLSIITARFIIDAVLNAIMTVLAFIPVINILATVAAGAVGLLFVPVYYMFIANPHYPTDYYFNASIRYMSGHILRYLGLVLIHIIPMILVLVAMLALGLVGRLLGLVAAVFIMCLLDLKIAEFVAGIIPDEWYMGTARF